MKKLTIKLLFSFAVLTQICLTSCNDSESVSEPDFPAFITYESFYEGSAGATVTITGRNLTTPSDIEIIVGEDFSVSPSEITDESLSFIVPMDFNSGKMKIIADDEVIVYSYFKFLDNTDVEIISSDLTVYALDFIDSQNGLYLDNRDVLYRTTNGGDSWTAINDHSYENRFYAVDKEVIWNQLDHRTIEVSKDGGRNWESSRIREDLIIDHFYAIKDEVLVIGTLRNENNGILYSSTDNGQTWVEKLSTEKFGSLRNFRIIYNDGEKVSLYDPFDRILINNYIESEWQQTNIEGVPLFSLRENAINIASENAIWYPTHSGLAFSAEIGKTSKEYEVSLSGTSELVFAIHFFNESDGMAIASDGGILRTKDSGDTWELTHLKGNFQRADFLQNEKAVILLKDDLSSIVKLNY